MGLDRKNRKKFDIREEYYVSSCVPHFASLDRETAPQRRIGR